MFGWHGNILVVYNLLRHCNCRHEERNSFKANVFLRHILNINTIHNCMKLILRNFLIKIRSVPNEIKMNLHIKCTLWQW